MSAYTTRWCPKHGEWDEDVDNPSECCACLEEGIAPSQLKDAELTRLAARVAELEGEQEKLLACVKAADAYFEADANSVLKLNSSYSQEEIDEVNLWLETAEKWRVAYRAARAEVEKP